MKTISIVVGRHKVNLDTKFNFGECSLKNLTQNMKNMKVEIIVGTIGKKRSLDFLVWIP